MSDCIDDKYPPKGTVIVFETLALEVYMSPTLYGMENHYFNSTDNSGKVIVLDYGYISFSKRFKLKVLFVDNGIVGWIWPGSNFVNNWKEFVLN